METEEGLKQPIKSQTATLPVEVPKAMKVVVVNMDEVMFEGEVSNMIAPGPYGNFAILPGHTPLFIKLEKGTLVVSGEAKKELQIEGGVAKITQDKVVVLVGF